MTQGPDRESLAEFEQKLRLVRVSDLDGTQHFAIETLDDEGDVTDAAPYTHDEFPLVASIYNHRTLDFIEPSNASAFDVGMRGIDAIAAFDHETLAALVHDDFVWIDHRPISYPTLDRAQYLEVILAQSDAIQVWLTQAIPAATSTMTLSSGGFWTANFGEWSPFEHGIYLNVLESGQVLRIEVYPDGQLDAALARFGELSEDTRQPAK